MVVVRAPWRLDLGAVLVYLALGVMFSAVPRYVVEQLDGSKGLAGFAVSVFFVAAVLARPVAGRIADTRGRRPVLVAAPFIVAAAMLGLHLADHIGVVLVLRFVQGLAGGAFYVAAVTAETDMAPPHRRASAVARLSIAIYTGFALGPVLGERLTDLGSGGVWTAAAVLAGAGGLLTRTVPETRPAEDVPAATGEPPPGAPIDTTAATRTPLIARAAVLPGVTLLTLGVGYASVTSLSALYARAVGLDSSETLYVTYAVSIIVVRLAAGRLADRVGPLRVAFPGLASFVAGFALLAVVAALTGPVGAVAPMAGVTLVGVGWALVFPAVIAWVVGDTSADARGAATGTLVALMDVGQGAGGYLVGAVADRAGFAWALVLPAVLATAGSAVLGVAARRRPPGSYAAPRTARTAGPEERP